MPLFSEKDLIPLQIASAAHRPELAGEVVAVFPGGPADLAGVLAGDLISAVNGSPVEDVIDVQFYSAEERCVLTVHRGGRILDLLVPKDIDQLLGLEFREDLFDGIRICANRCDFCFVDQQPAGMRQTLGIRDDDYRLSFLHGNFVTLTNLSEHDWDRIFRQRLSPLYISVHATDTSVRRRLLRNKRANDVLADIQSLLDHRISVHTQVVLCEGMNDGAVLDKTIEGLGLLYPGVQSLAVVPMGVTDYRLARNESDPYGPAGARRVLRQIRAWQRRFETEFGTRFVTASDEFYLVANQPLPRAYTYQGYPQLSNGVGGRRMFLDELTACVRKLPRDHRTGRLQFVTGQLARPLIERFAIGVRDVFGYQTQVVPAVNNWYGPSVTVTGLLTGRDVRDALNKAGQADLCIIPDVMLREGTNIFLDDMTVGQLEREVGRAVLPVSPWPHPAFEAIRKI